SSTGLVRPRRSSSASSRERRIQPASSAYRRKGFCTAPASLPMVGMGNLRSRRKLQVVHPHMTRHQVVKEGVENNIKSVSLDHFCLNLFPNSVKALHDPRPFVLVRIRDWNLGSSTGIEDRIHR